MTYQFERANYNNHNNKRNEAKIRKEAIKCEFEFM